MDPVYHEALKLEEITERLVLVTRTCALPGLLDNKKAAKAE